MARVLCVWELGTRLGHLNHLRLPIEVALGRGHEVVVAARELPGVRDVLADMPITLLQAPFKQGIKAADRRSFLSHTHLLGNQCFSSAVELESYVRAWSGLFDVVRPDIVLFEHSPTALIAAFGYAFKKVLVGSSFALPPAHALAVSPFLPFPTTPQTDAVFRQLKADDAQVLGVIAAALKRIDFPPLPSLSDIYAQAHARFLTTWPVLDHFCESLGPRVNERYLGLAPLTGHPSPPWSDLAGDKVFGLLQNFPSLPQFLRDLQAAQVSALLYVRDLPPGVRDTFSSATMRFIDGPVDLGQVAQQAAWVAHHGNHGTMATFALSGVPQLVIPCYQEQLFGALGLVHKGCGAMAFQDQPVFTAAIHALTTNKAMKQSAMQVASQCAPFDMDANKDFIGQTFDDLLTYQRA
jgi:hypothetical protein